jgi:APA family basic amino acid/polyamine antiporter
VALTGVKRAAVVQNACMLAKLLVIAALIVGGLAFVRGAGAPAPAAAGALPGVTPESLLLALLPLFYTLGGWQLAGYIAPEVRDPARTLPRAIVLGVSGVVLVYLAVNATTSACSASTGWRATRTSRARSRSAPSGRWARRCWPPAWPSRPSGSAP